MNHLQLSGTFLNADGKFPSMILSDHVSAFGHFLLDLLIFLREFLVAFHRFVQWLVVVFLLSTVSRTNPRLAMIRTRALNKPSFYYCLGKFWKHIKECTSCLKMIEFIPSGEKKELYTWKKNFFWSPAKYFNNFYFFIIVYW